MAGGTNLNNRKPYNGDRRALVLAFDVGTTFSGVSYAFLDPGEVPKIHGVTRYPGQEHVTGNTKIPSLLYYARSGRVVAAGAEAETGQVQDRAEDEGWYKVELFKLRLRPRRMELDMNGMRLSPLPPGKSSEDVFGDFLAYLFSCTRSFIRDTHANGKNLWKAVEKDIHFVLSHPNGWEGPQQTRMRRAAISGGLIPNTDEGKARIRFVTEGESSMHACILSGLAHDVLASGNGFIVADAGGGTLDVSSYILRGTHPLQIEEVAPPDCVFAGAVFVSRRCRIFLEEKLRSSKYGSPDILDHITKRFDETTKRLFRDKHDPQYIQFGSPLDKDMKVGIRGGQLKLQGSEVAELFEPSIQAAVASIRRQIELARGSVKAVWLVGGFAASPWLFSQLQQRLAPLSVTVNRPDSQTSKAVADGAIGFFCDHHVSARMSRYMYGVEYLREIDVNDEEHLTRSGRQLQLPSGPKYLPDAFDCILAKNVRVKESSVFSRKYYTEVTKLSTLSVFEIEIWCYRGGETIPKWIDRNSDQFGSLCFVRADLSKLSNSAEPKKGANAQTYWTVVFSIEIHFGLTEFKARMKWNEDGKVRYGPATIVYNEKGVRSDEDDAYSVAGGDEAMSVSPRRPYGSLLSHGSREPSSTSRSTRHRERDRERGSISREHSHRGAPSLSGTGMSRSMSGHTDTASVETVTQEPSPFASVPSSVSRSMSGRSRSRGLGSTAPSAREVEPELAPVLEREDPSVHSRAPTVTSPPSMHSRAPSVSAPMSTPHSRAPSTVVPPSMHSRTPSVAPSPSIHSRAPSVAAAPAPSIHSRAPSAAPAPSVPHSRTPSVAPAASPVVSRAPSAAPAPSVPAVSRAPSAAPAASVVPSRAPSATSAPAASPVPSRAPSAGSRPSVSRAPSSASRVPTVTRQSSTRSGPGSRAPSQMAPVSEGDGDLYVPTEPDVSGSAAEYFNSAPSAGAADGLDATRTRTRSISPAPPAASPPVEEGWEVPTVSVVPPAGAEKKDEKKGWGIGGSAWGAMFGSANGKPAEDHAEPPTLSRDIPFSSFDNANEPFVPPVSGGASWGDAADNAPVPGGWGFEPPVTTPAAVPEPPAPAPEPEPEVAPPVVKTNSSQSSKKSKKQPKGILKNSSASSKAAEAEAKAKAKSEAEARERAEAKVVAATREKAEAEARARAQAEAEELARQQHVEAEVRAREQAEAERQQRLWELAEAEARAREQAEAEHQQRLWELAEQQERERQYEEEMARLQAEEERLAREEEARLEAEIRAHEEAEALARAEREPIEKREADAHAQAEEEAAAVAAEAEAKAKEEEAAATPAPANDEGRIKLEAAVEKAEKDVEKAEEEFNKAEVALAKLQKPASKGAKNKKKGAGGPGPAERAAERTVDEKKSALDAAKEKSQKAKDALDAHTATAAPAVPAAEPSAAPDTEPPADEPEEPAPPVQAPAMEKVESTEAKATTKEEEAATQAHAAADAAAEAQEQAEAVANAAETGAGAGDANERDAGAASAPAVDDESVKLQEAVEKAEKELEKATDEFNVAEVKLAKIPKPKAKGKNKGKPAQSPAAVAAEREVTAATSKKEMAEKKLEKAKEALAAHVPTGAPAPAPAEPTTVPDTEPPAQAPAMEKVESFAGGKGGEGEKNKKNAAYPWDDEQNDAGDNPLGDFGPPISKASSNAGGKGKKSMFDFSALGGDEEEEREVETGGGENGGGGMGGALFGGLGGWGMGGKSGTQGGETGLGWNFKF